MGPAPIHDRLAISGNIEITDVEVAFRLPGRVVARGVSEGETVQMGQLVARLDDVELSHEVGLRRAELAAVTANLSELTAGYRIEEIGQARAALARGQAEAERARVEFERQEDLLAGDVISEREFETADAANRIALAQVEELGQKLRLLERGPRREQLDAARERVRQAEEALALAETRLSYATLTSPQAGLVLADHVEPGEQVAAGTPVVTVGDLSNVWLRGYIDEQDLGRVKVGQRVRVTTDAYPEKAYTGSVTFISSEAEFTPKSVQTTKERVKLVYRIKVEVANPAAELKPGMPADGEIALAGE
jgi:HlyD family secretion protein